MSGVIQEMRDNAYKKGYDDGHKKGLAQGVRMVQEKLLPAMSPEQIKATLDGWKKMGV